MEWPTTVVFGRNESLTETDLRRFADCLHSTTSFKPKVVDWYQRWVRQFAGFSSARRLSPWEDSALGAFLKDPQTNLAGWQLRQAQDAIERYRRFRLREFRRASNDRAVPGTWDGAIIALREELRLQQKSLRTEKTYVHWAKDFSRSLSAGTPEAVDQRHVRSYLTELAVTRGVASSTQKQAFIALLFFFRHVLHRSIDDLSETVRARKPRRLPGGAMTVRSGKWDKDRVTLLPAQFRDPAPGGRIRRQDRTGATRARRREHNDDLHACCYPEQAGRDQPRGQAADGRGWLAPRARSLRRRRITRSTARTPVAFIESRRYALGPKQLLSLFAASPPTTPRSE